MCALFRSLNYFEKSALQKGVGGFHAWDSDCSDDFKSFGQAVKECQLFWNNNNCSVCKCDLGLVWSLQALL